MEKQGVIMALINLFDVDTKYGYKKIELHHEDLSCLSFSIDLLVVSSFEDKYGPLKNTLPGFLYENCGINLRELRDHAQIDLRNSLSTWMTGEFEGFAFKRIALIEMRGGGFGKPDVEQKFKNLFSLIALALMQEIKITSIALPILGSGNQRLNPDEVLRYLLPTAIRSLENLTFLEKICFVEINEKKIELLDSAMNDLLNRKEEDLQSLGREQMTIALKDEMIYSVNSLIGILPKEKQSARELLKEIKDRFNGERLRMFELSILSRRLAEEIVYDILGDEYKDRTLSKNIGLLYEYNIAEWVISYLHVLRIFGNIAAHTEKLKESKPSKAERKDLVTLISCLNRVIDFWYHFKSGKNNNK